MDREEISKPIPIDLVREILSRLPAKSIVRFRCVSKLWKSILSRSCFTELFLTRSYARPRLLLAVEREREWLFYSSTQPQNPYEKSSLVVAAGSHIKFPGVHTYDATFVPLSVSGFIYITHMRISEEVTNNTGNVICNPSTGQYAILPESWRSFLGFDPTDKQFKVLSMGDPFDDHENTQILTLGNGNLRWRKIHCPYKNDPNSGEICINGVLYYLATRRDTASRGMVCFDVKSEKFRFIDRGNLYGQHQVPTLVNYKGKLGGVMKYDVKGRIVGLRMWVLEDVEKHELKIYDYSHFRCNEVIGGYVSVHGVTRAGEIVLSPNHTSTPFYVFYFNPETNTLRRVEIQGPEASFEGFNRIYTFVDHVENLNFFNIESS